MAGMSLRLPPVPAWSAALIAALIGFGGTVALVVQAMRVLPLGTAYAVWTGIGVAGAAIAGILLLGESIAPFRLVAICVIVAGVAMLKLADG